MASALPRITARVDLDTQELLSQAAAIAGMSSINSFVLSAAVEKAKTIMERERALQLSQQDAMTLMTALDQPAKPNSKLQKAASRYMDKTQE
ncbi:type II toxin-antitoxin system TacA family antitoxin [Aliivibrio wodanis]|uniref:type II toxin-antitoxin system TacA family antitoxin n=1 Tax=Aliivibrio wodanis TaxID=80852 RepID=UPI00406D20A4